MSLHVTVIAGDRKLEDLVRSSGLRPTVASADDLVVLAHPTAVQPDVVVLDVRGHNHVPPAVAMLKRQHPTTSVLLVATALDPALMLEAMRAGVNECVAGPLTAATLGDALARMVTDRGLPAAGEVFAFVGAKGGVGTTTLAVNLATALSKTAPTLFVDLQSAYGDANILLGAEARFSVTDALENTHRLDPSFFSSLAVQTAPGPVLLASPDRPSAAGVDPHRVRLLLDFAARNYRYIVLDVARSSPAVIDGIEIARSIFVVTNQELAAVRSAGRIVDTLRQRHGRDKVSVVVSRFDPDNEITTDDIERAVHRPVRFTLPNDYRVALQALNEGRPFALVTRNKLATAVVSFAAQLTGQTADEPVTAAKPAAKLITRLASLRWTPTS